MNQEALARRLSLLDSLSFIKVSSGEVRQLRVIRGENRAKIVAPIIEELTTNVDQEKAYYIQKLLVDHEYNEEGECVSILQGEERAQLESALVDYIVAGGEL
ncbi:hypothetical protein [Bacteroides neonati]|uniref:hypothetical protein n=1 Tax=Bacteroides neonati TaxID=1347393 RepID=UPI0004B81658|nr:hypothetical protein [Bacteroides neonati]